MMILTAHANYVITSTAAASLFTILLITPSFLVLHDDHIASNHGCVHSGCACCEQCCLNVARVPSEISGHGCVSSGFNDLLFSVTAHVFTAV